MWPLSAKQIYEIITDGVCDNPSFENTTIKGVCQDSRKVQPHQMFVAIKGDKLDGHDYLKECFQKKIPLALVQENSPILKELTTQEKAKCICVPDIIEALRKLAKFMRDDFSFPVIGVGGSNGKTTTKEMIYSMLNGLEYKVTKTEKSENGYLGLPLTLLQEGHNNVQPPNALVLEIGIDEIGAMHSHIQISRPDIVLLTALGPEHLTGLNDWDTAVKEELILFSSRKTSKIWQLFDQKIKKYYFDNLKNNLLNYEHDYIVIEKNDYNGYLIEVSPYNYPKNKAALVWSLVNEKNDASDVSIEIHGSISLNNSGPYVYSIPLLGKHNAANFALAFATALCIGKNPPEILKGFKKFAPPPMRSNISTFPNGAVLYNDTYNASPLSMEAALGILENPTMSQRPKLVLLGDMLDLGSESNYWHECLVPTLTKLKHTHLCLYGSAMYSCYKLLNEKKDHLLKENGTHILWLDAKEDPKTFLDKINVNLKSHVILVKGSRGMKLERFVKVVEEKCRSS